MRTTIDIDGPVLKDLKRLQKREGTTLGKLVSELLEQALQDRKRRPAPRTLRWTARPMGPAKVDLEDREAVAALLDREDAPS